jgi:leukotriene-A4 hydrolase
MYHIHEFDVPHSHLFVTHSFTKLIPDLQDGADPDDAFSSVPYEKGFNFLYYLQHIVGGEDVMNPFLQHHVKTFQGSTVDSFEWKDFFLKYMKEHAKDKSKLDQIDWQKWFHEPGMPCEGPLFGDKLAKSAKSTAVSFVSTFDASRANENIKMIQDTVPSFSNGSIVVFLDTLLSLQSEKNAVIASGACTASGAEAISSAWCSMLDTLDAVVGFSKSKNCELLFRWLTLNIRENRQDYLDKCSTFAVSYGRMKYCRPMFRDIYKSKIGKEHARNVFLKHKNFYHNIAAKMISKDLEIKL